MHLLLSSLLVLLFGSAFAGVLSRRPLWAARVGVMGAVVGGGLGFVAAAKSLLTGSTESWSMQWSMPGDSFHLAMDPMSALFLLPVFGLGALAALYGMAYLKGAGNPAAVGTGWFFYNILVSSMALVVVAHNAVLFLLAWESMSLASFFLVAYENEKEQARTAAWVYTVAAHLGTAFLLVMFLLLDKQAGSMDFDAFKAVGSTLSSSRSNLIFLLALLGFGVKAGFVPLHVWLPEAHPAAPSHVSALMSGAMIKMGIYGLLRTLTLLSTPPSWWGWCLVGIGLSSGILGVLFALAQHDLKRLLAYHSVENIGIIALGIGVGLIGLSNGLGALAALGFAGAFLHVLNHAIFKGLLFLGAGSVLHATGSLEIDHLGGLLKKMPWTGVTFLIGAVAISGLPPLNGFISEFLVYLGAFQGVTTGSGAVVVVCLGVIAGLALIGGLAAACFTKAFGIVFLGEPRSSHATLVHEAPLMMRAPMLALAAGCAIIGLLGPFVLRGLAPALGVLLQVPTEVAQSELAVATLPLVYVCAACAGLVLVTALLALLRKRLLARRSVQTTVTWDCGYAQPTPRMQYTASSFAQPLTGLFRLLLGTRRHVTIPEGVLPAQGSLSTETPDFFHERIYRPVFVSVAGLLVHLRGMQQGRVQLYVLYIALTLIALLLFNMK